MSQIAEIEGDLFDAPDGAVLIHACNCQGVWGAGIAAAFRAKYPSAYQIYRHHCLAHHPANSGTDKDKKQGLEGTTLIIPPQPEDYRQPSASTSADSGQKPDCKRHWIVCLFTSNHYSPRKRSSLDSILENTRSSVTDLKTQLGEWGYDNDTATGKGEDDKPGALYSCRINAGLFDVPWKQSKSILEESGLKMTIVRPPGEEE